jgi:glutamate-1-semialdehyde 2,1-aminomutase
MGKQKAMHQTVSHSSQAIASNPSSEDIQQRQRQHVADLMSGYIQRTKASKHLAQAHRRTLTDSRYANGFRLLTKEVNYPIVGQRSAGSKLWDVDGNEYIDLMMGYGINLLGHNPPFVKAAIAAQLEQGMQIGSQAEHAGEVAALICELTGMERVSFCNSGTEAVMTAVRIARAVTGRSKIAMFAGSYHGHWDGTLASLSSDPEPQTIPRYPGVSSNTIEDVLVLEYDDVRSLAKLQAHQQELAAVLVEPVQSRCPHLQPQAFLQQLRQLTSELGIPLIFDEMVTGFRIHPGGAQAWFGVTADIATYGKIVGGGLPIGVVAGKAAYMDAVDGGFWRYGDDSAPQVKTTFTAGTFCRHPLAMAAARAVLTHLQQEGASLQATLNQRTTEFISRLNAYFRAEQVPVQLANFGSLFSVVTHEITSDKNDTTADTNAATQGVDLLQYHLLNRGILIRGGGGFLSTAHTDEDIERIIWAVQDSVAAMRAGAILPSPELAH